MLQANNSASEENLNFSAELIPHEDFHRFSWLRSTKRPLWHYFCEQNKSLEIEQVPYPEGVDTPLEKLIRLLHGHGIKTSPSCSGHHLESSQMNHIYDTLMLDRHEIIQDGLELKDVETGLISFFQEPNYVLPWTRDTFIERLNAYQGKGIVGLYLKNNQKLKENIQKLRLSGLNIIEKDQVLLLISDWKKSENLKSWDKITSLIEQLIKDCI